MAISTQDLAELAKISLDEYLRNTPIDQIGTDRPLLKMLMKGRKQFLGAKQNVVVGVRKDYGSNFSWAYGETPVAFNKRNTTENATFPWRRAVDALYIDYDRLFGAGIKVREGERGAYKLEQNEKVQLVNLIDEQMEVLREGFFEKLDIELHRSGTSSADAVVGMDALVATSPAVGVVGGIDRATNAWWRNNALPQVDTAVKGTLLNAMEKQWRGCIAVGGGAPDFILAGEDFIDAYRNEMTITYNTNAGNYKTIDGGTGSGTSTSLFFKGVEILWDPKTVNLDALETVGAGTPTWKKRCYMLNSKKLKLRDDSMDIVSPTRPHNVLAMYAMVNLRLALTIDKPNSMSVIGVK